MSIKNEGKQCSVCHAYLFEEDDVVYCPECAAPHHRDCYNSIGHCALEELHGTDKQYDIVKRQQEEAQAEKQEHTENSRVTVKCGMCGEDYPIGDKQCPKCHTPNTVGINTFVGYDFLGGVPADMDIGEGVTADEAKRFVAVNTPRYIPKFAAMSFGKKASWNWLAFLFPCGWFLSRKMYIKGIIFGILTVAITLLQFPLVLAVDGLGIAGGSYMQLTSMIAENLDKIGGIAVLLAFASLVLDLALRIVSGLFGDAMYRRYALSNIKDIKNGSADIELDYRKLGGVNFFAMLIGLLAVQYLPTIILAFM